MLKRLKFYAVTILVLALALTALYYRLQAGRAQAGITRSLDGAAIVRQVQQLNELVTVRYTIQKPIGLKEQKPVFGSESVMMLVQAQVLAGVNLGDLRPADIAMGPDRAVSLRLPPPRLLHLFIDDNQTQVWDRQKTLFVAANPQLEQNARQAALESVQQAALAMGILSNAQLNAEQAVRSLLQGLGFEPVRFLPAR